jgi:hypothetical protein
MVGIVGARVGPWLIAAMVVFLAASNVYAIPGAITDCGTGLSGLRGISDVDGYYSLENDVDCAGTDFTPILNGYTFKGTFDGQGHRISNVVINMPSSQYVGLFSIMDGAELRNVSLVNVNVTGDDDVGGLVGYATSSTITGCDASGVVSGASDDVGGLIGYGSGLTVAASSADVRVSGNDYVGGLLGYSEDSSLTGSSALGEVSGHDYVGGLVGTQRHETFCFLGDTPVLMADFTHRQIRDVKAGDYVRSFDEQRGVFFNARVVKTFRHMADRYLLINGGLKVTSNHPLYVNGAWVPAGEVSVGDMLSGEDLANVTVRSISKVFGQVPVYNLEVDTGNVSAGSGWGHNYFAGGLLAHNKLLRKGDVQASGSDSGSDVVVDFISTENISDCHASGKVTAETYVGGLAGASYADVLDSYAEGDVFGTSRVGGLIGYFNGAKATRTYASGSIVQDGEAAAIVGGLIGEAVSSTINESFSWVRLVNGTGVVGGLIGSSTDSDVYDSYSRSNVMSSGDYVGGLVGKYQNGASAKRTYASGNVSGPGGYHGGLIGYLVFEDVSDSFATGEVTGQSGTTGAVVGSDFFIGDYVGTITNVWWNNASTPAKCKGEGVADCHAVYNNLNYFQGTGSPTSGPMGAWDFDTVWNVTNGYPILKWQPILTTTAVPQGGHRGMTKTRHDLAVDIQGPPGQVGSRMAFFVHKKDVPDFPLFGIGYRISLEGSSQQGGASDALGMVFFTPVKAGEYEFATTDNGLYHKYVMEFNVIGAATTTTVSTTSSTFATSTTSPPSTSVKHASTTSTTAYLTTTASSSSSSVTTSTTLKSESLPFTDGAVKAGGGSNSLLSLLILLFLIGLIFATVVALGTYGFLKSGNESPHGTRLGNV